MSGLPSILTKSFLVLVSVLWTVGCTYPQGPLWPPQAGTPTKLLYVSLDAWHAMIGFHKKDLRDSIRSDSSTLSKTSRRSLFEEWGYAERAWYLEGQTGLIGVIRALFWPTEAVVEVAESSHLWVERTPQPPAQLFRFPISETGYHALRQYLTTTLASREPLAVHFSSRFYPARSSYHLFHHCYHYVVQALRVAGLPVSPVWAFTRAGLAFHLARLEAMVHAPNRT
ncbi:MAG: DUF2459 domain-containing protein [Nitrospirae bacterium]|nr:MAG: DUF2459 domain-containing protein [Nitrospirota bacterium]